jgi:hypothetical protein
VQVLPVPYVIGLGEHETEIDGVSSNPVPVRFTNWLVVIPLSASVSVPMRDPGAVGVKIMGTEQLAPGASVVVALPQVFPAATVKSPVMLGFALNNTS